MATPAAPRIAARYARKSNRDQEGIESQHETTAAAATRDGYVAPDEFAFGDDDTSSVTTARGGLDRLRELVESGRAPFDRVYIKNPSRFGRWGDVRRRAALELWFEDRGVYIRYANQPNQPLDRSNTKDPAVIAHALTDVVESARNSMERDRTRENTVAERRRMFARGQYPGPGNTPYGVDRVLVDTATGVVVRRLPLRGRVSEPGHHVGLAWAPGPARQVVREIFEAIAAGASLRGIARALNARGEPTPGARFGPARPGADRRWTPETVRAIARHPNYVGDVVYGRTMSGRGKHAAGGGRRRAPRAPGERFVRRWPDPASRRAREASPEVPLGAPPAIDQAQDRWITPEEFARAQRAEDPALRALADTAPIVRRGDLPDPPVERTLFDAVQRILDARPERAGAGRPSDNYLLTGAVRCAACGAVCYGQTYRPRPYRPRAGARRRARRAGRRSPVSGYRYYVHYRKDPAGAAVASACPHAGRSVPADAVEAHALSAARVVLAGPALIDYVRAELARQLAAAGGPGPVDERAALADAAARAAVAHASALGAFVDAPTDVDTRAALARLVEERAAALQSARRRLEQFDARAAGLEAAAARADAYYAAAPDLVGAFDALAPADRRRALTRVVARVGVFWDAAPNGHAVEVEALALPADDAGLRALLAARAGPDGAPPP